jgi:pyrimidine-nucleoside phosphorylase
MRAVDLIRRKRDSGELSREEIRQLIAAYTAGDIPDYQMSAWLMAVVLRGMSRAETAALTEAMLHSGRVLDFSDLPGRKVDKHSTGGVGDKTSLVIAPVVAAGGLKVPMISGRGLGHTGGTLDKLESIPGFNVNLSLIDFRHVLETCGCALIGQTAEIAPADKKIYALRDVSGTVESPALICASIMSKKLAEGIDALVLDVKTGSGAFMKNIEDAASLAELLVETGKHMGKTVVALLTDMNQPLGRTAGNALEVAEAIEALSGGGPADLRELCLELAGWMFYLGERVKTVDEGKKLSQELIASGRAREKFREIVRLQGGDVGVVDDPRRLARARQTLDVTSPADGYVARTQCEQLGLACVLLGGGREKKEDTIDPAAGLEFHKRIGNAVERGEPLCTLHYNTGGRLEEARRLVETAYRIEPEKPKAIPPLVHRVIGVENHWRKMPS